jgi:hypothetical protein
MLVVDENRMHANNFNAVALWSLETMLLLLDEVNALNTIRARKIPVCGLPV